MFGRVVIYTKKMDEMVAFYRGAFGFEPHLRPGDRITEMRHPVGGASLMFHQAGAKQKQGQAIVKLVMDTADVAAKRAALIEAGYQVGPIMQGGGYEFANLKDPSGNSVQISSRFVLEDGH